MRLTSRRHRRTVSIRRYAEAWACACGFLTWKARRPGDDRLARRRALDQTWNQHIVRANRRALRRVK